MLCVSGWAAAAGIEDALTAELTLAFHEVLGIPPENIYIKYEDITAWGVGGMYIDRRQFR